MAVLNTKDLSGAALDWAVASATGQATPGRFIYGTANKHLANRETADFIYDWDNGVRRYSPSTDWAIAGPIIERERIELLYFGADGYGGNAWEAQIGCDSHCIDQLVGEATGGPTALIAAMRAYVLAKLGCAVDVPDELRHQARHNEA